jgi:hypothetical protein
MKTKNVFLVKFTAVAMLLGFFSPSVSVVNPHLQGVNTYSASLLHLNISLLNTAEARGGRGGGARGGSRGGMSRGGGVHRGGVNRGNSNHVRNKNINTNRNTNRNVNRNTNVNRNVNVNHYYGGGYHGGGRYGYWGGSAILAWTSAVVVGSWIAAATMPTTCTTFIHNGISYRQCGSSYYRPYYQGSTVVYQVVSSPY